MAEDEFYKFWFEKNLQGDIVAVYNDLGQKVCSYTYDAWGNCTSTLYTVGFWTAIVGNNPFRYRGYYLDAETGLYYLNSRYYDPNTGRFLNADSYVNANGDILGYNMFAYCGNNPVMWCDPSGTIIRDFNINVTDSNGYCGYRIHNHTNNKDYDDYVSLDAHILSLGGYSNITVSIYNSTTVVSKEEYNKKVSEESARVIISDLLCDILPMGGLISKVGLFTDISNIGKMDRPILEPGKYSSILIFIDCDYYQECQKHHYTFKKEKICVWYEY